MPKPWAIPPLPKRGDEKPDKTFAYVGFTMTRWESIEFELSRLHSRFLDAFDDVHAMREYGKPHIFRLRADNLSEAAAKYFRSHPDQKREAKFDGLLEHARGFADRRNDIAHGMVFRIDEITYFRQHIKPKLLHRPHFALIPPLYTVKAHRESGMPSFAYTSDAMNRIAYRFILLQAKVRVAHSGSEALKPSPSPSPPEPSDEK